MALFLYLLVVRYEGESAPKTGRVMKTILGISVAMLIWGNQAFASLPSASAGPEDLRKISDWAAHLNNYYPTLSLSVSVNLQEGQNARAVLRELKLLEEQLQGTVNMPAGALQMLACKHVICGDK